MKKTLLTALLIAPFLPTPAFADTTFGAGFGSLYNGIGLNFGRSTNTNLIFGSLGCMGWSSSESIQSSSSGVTREHHSDSNCGIGLGYVSSSMFTRTNHALGINLAYSYDTNELDGGSEVHLMPGYHYFFNGIGKRGLTLGAGSRLTFTDESLKTGITLTVGFQF